MNDGKKHNKKPPCAECKRYSEYRDVYGRTIGHYCESGIQHPITGYNIEHGCWWYRYSPFCKFESN